MLDSFNKIKFDTTTTTTSATRKLQKVTISDKIAATMDATITKATSDNNNNNNNNEKQKASKKKVNIVVVGCGSWTQGWHLPQLAKNPNINILALIDNNAAPTSNLNPNLETLPQLSMKYHNAKLYRSIEDFYQTRYIQQMDGIIIATPHSSHYGIGEIVLQEGIRRMKYTNSQSLSSSEAPLSIFMEKPMTTDVTHAKRLHELVQEYTLASNGINRFFINHSANYRIQTQKAYDIISSGTIGTIQHITAYFSSPLLWIFDDPANTGWNTPDPDTPNMIGNGFAWGQSSHIFAWIYYVCGGGNGSGSGDGDPIQPETVFCCMNHSAKTGADISHTARITCSNNIIMNISGTVLLSGNPNGAKEIRIEIVGSNGKSLLYYGNDQETKSGKLELHNNNDNCSFVGNKNIEIIYPSFDFEELQQTGYGPQSLQTFINSCFGGDGHPIENKADSLIGLKTVQTIDAMYQSNHLGRIVTISK